MILGFNDEPSDKQKEAKPEWPLLMTCGSDGSAHLLMLAVGCGS